MSKCLTPDQLRQYRERSVAFPLRILSDQQTQVYRQSCEDLEQALGGTPRTIELRQMHLHFRWAFELATHAPLVDAAEDLLGPDLLLWATELFIKRPCDGAVSIGWHRDGPYMGFDPAHAVTAWIALSPSTPANGCMQVVPEPESGDRTAQPSPRHKAEGAEGAPDAGRQECRSEQTPLDIVLAPGEMSLHNPFVLHGSGINRSGEKRIGFVVRFVAPTARPRNGRPPAVLIRGEDRHGYFQLINPPGDMELGRAIAGLRESAARHLDAMLDNTRVERRRAEGRPASRSVVS